MREQLRILWVNSIVAVLPSGIAMQSPLFGAYLWTVVVRSLQLAYFHSRLLRSKHDHAGVGEDQ